MREEEGSLTAHVKRTRKISRGEFKEGREGEKKRERKTKEWRRNRDNAMICDFTICDGHGIGGAYYYYMWDIIHSGYCP